MCQGGIPQDSKADAEKEAERLNRAERRALSLNRRHQLAQKEREKLADKAIVYRNETGEFPVLSDYLIDDYSGDLYRLVRYRGPAHDDDDCRAVIVAPAAWSDNPTPAGSCWLLLNAVRA